MSAIRIEIESTISNKRLNKWCQDAQNFLSIQLNDLKKINFFKIESSTLSSTELLKEIRENNKCEDVFLDPITDIIYYQQNQMNFQAGPEYSFAVEISFKAGVTDNSAHTAQEALKLLELDLKVASGKVYFLYGDLTKDQAVTVSKDLLANPLIESIEVFTRQQFLLVNRFQEVTIPLPKLETTVKVQPISLDGDDSQLMEISQSRCLALTLEEMKHIKTYYQDTEVIAQREILGLPVNPTDIEIEVFAQTWSEHCKHKIFSSNINYSEKNIAKDYFQLEKKEIKSLYKTCIKGATSKIKQDRKLDWLISVFSDNAGIVRFDQKIDLAIKVETHNSPSALDPYGGALTGILGVNRDILGCGLGARPIANTDVFCFAPPNWPSIEQKDQLPKGLKHPRRILEGVHLGIEDGGNKSGIPTVNGAIYFDQDYAGKPLVFCGTVGAMPQKLNDNTLTSEKYHLVGDRIVMIGGAIGRDGIHGATFSSMELNEFSPVTAVQIGDPLTQKRVLDFIIEARDLKLFTSLTDNGAGGLSSSVGEMAIKTNGAMIDLALCPTKYPGLTPYELFISESQERMTMAVAPDQINNFLKLAKSRGVDATDIGVFNDSGFLTLKYGQQIVGQINLDFLHQSLPPMELTAIWDGPRERKSWQTQTINKAKLEQAIKENSFYQKTLLNLLANPNIASKKPWVRRYDHEVQAATHIKPFCGESALGPSDCGVIWTYPHGGEKNNAIAISCGLAPRISLYDPYLMAQFAVDEAIRNIISSGGDIDNTCLLDNFCWPDPVKTKKNPDGDYKLGQLVRTCYGLYDICLEYGTPLVSGKDSMKNDFRGKKQNGQDLTISILPTLLVTAMGKAGISHTTTTDFKKAGDLIYLIGKKSEGLLASEFHQLFDNDNIDDSLISNLPEIDIKSNKKLYQTCFAAFQNDLFKSCHDISDGGLLTTICESMIGSNLGASIQGQEINDLQLNGLQISNFLFSEGPGRFVVSIAPADKEKFEKCFSTIEHIYLGKTTDQKTLTVIKNNQQLINLSLEDIKNSWTTEF